MNPAFSKNINTSPVELSWAHQDERVSQRIHVTKTTANSSPAEVNYQSAPPYTILGVPCHQEMPYRQSEETLPSFLFLHRTDDEEMMRTEMDEVKNSNSATRNNHLRSSTVGQQSAAELIALLCERYSKEYQVPQKKRI